MPTVRTLLANLDKIELCAPVKKSPKGQDKVTYFTLQFRYEGAPLKIVAEQKYVIKKGITVTTFQDGKVGRKNVHLRYSGEEGAGIVKIYDHLVQLAGEKLCEHASSLASTKYAKYFSSPEKAVGAFDNMPYSDPRAKGFEGDLSTFLKINDLGDYQTNFYDIFGQMVNGKFPTIPHSELMGRRIVMSPTILVQDVYIGTKDLCVRLSLDKASVSSFGSGNDMDEDEMRVAAELRAGVDSAKADEDMPPQESAKDGDRHHDDDEGHGEGDEEDAQPPPPKIRKFVKKTA